MSSSSLTDRKANRSKPTLPESQGTPSSEEVDCWNSPSGDFMAGNHDPWNQPSGDFSISSVGTPSYRRQHSSKRGILSVREPSRRPTNSLKDWTIDKLNFDKLHGRDKEIAQLGSVLESMTEQKQTQLVLISAASGTGKTVLAQRTLQPLVDRTKEGILVRGKFDQQNAEPYSALASAMSQVISQVLVMTGGEHFVHDFREDLLADLGSDGISLLSRIIPVLDEVILLDHHESQQQDKVGNDNSSVPSNASILTTTDNRHEEASQTARNRSNYAWLSLFRIVTKRFRPFVMILDDLQWADGASLELLPTILLDRQNEQPIMVVGIYRSNEGIEEQALVNHFLQDLSEFCSNNANIFTSEDTDEHDNPNDQKPRLVMHEIRLVDLDFDAVHALVQDVLRSTDETAETLGLAELCLKRTQGNPFFLVQFLSMLQAHQLLTFNLATLKWNWNCEEIEAQSRATDNVVDLLRSQMLQLDAVSQRVLQLASYLGTSFHFETLDLLWADLSVVSNQNISDEVQAVAPDSNDEEVKPECVRSGDAESNTPKSTDLMKALRLLEDGGYIQRFGSEDSGNHRYEFCHDRIQESSNSLGSGVLGLPATTFERENLSRKIGNILSTKLPPEALDSAIFVTVDLLNSGAVPGSEKERMDLAHLNLRACRKAVAISAFEAASIYSSKGIELIGDGEEGWHADYSEMTLELYSLGSGTESFLGHVELMESYYNKVVSRQALPLEAKLSVYTVYLNSIANRGRPKEAVNLAVSLLKKFGCRFPKTKVGILLSVLYNVVKIKKLLKTGMDELDSLPLVNDPTRCQILLILDQLVTHFFLCNDSRLPLAVFRSLEWTRKFGLNDFSSSALATSGMIISGALGDHPGGSVLAKKAIAFSTRLPETAASRSLFVANALVLAWTEPLRTLLKPLLHSYDMGLRTGDIESAAWAILHFVIYQFMTGTPIDLLVKDLSGYCIQFQELKQIFIARTMEIYRNVWATLGSAMFSEAMKDCPPAAMDTILNDWIDSTQRGESTKSEELSVTSTENALKSYVLTLFGGHTEVAQRAQKKGVDVIARNFPGSPGAYFEAFSNGVSCFAAARQTGNRRYRKLGCQVRKRIKRWLDGGNTNVGHWDALLDAEYEALKGRTFAAKQKYEISILLSARGGILLDSGYAAERYGVYLGELGEDEASVFRLKQAVQYYREIAAHGMVAKLEERYPDLSPLPGQIVTRNSS